MRDTLVRVVVYAEHLHFYHIDVCFCSSTSLFVSDLLSIAVISQRICLIGADAVIVVVTVYYTYGTMKMSREANIPATFSRTLHRAGQSMFTYTGVYQC